MSFTCVTCSLAFFDAASQREHMKSEWHRYNLKRRVAQLPPIDEETFNVKISAMSVENESSEPAKQNTQVTKKQLKRQQKEALQAKKRELLLARDALRSQRDGSNEATSTESVAEVEESNNVPKDTVSDISGNHIKTEEDLIAEKFANRVELPLTTCLFCPAKANKNFDSIEDNVEHMFKEHGLYIPERNYLVDRDGLLHYLGEKIGFGNVCLVCSYQGRNIEAVREHMRSKRHMRVPYETENEKLEVSDFYDFTSSYSDFAPVVSAPGNEDEEWEDLSDEADSEEDETFSEEPLVNMGTELILPTGAVVGHRSMAKYYRQNLPPDRILSEGQGTVIAAESRHFASTPNKKELAVAKRAWGQQRKRENLDDRRAARYVNNQPHFRDQLLQ